MRHHNVVPFDLARRGGLARRGAPDKAGDLAGESVVTECPVCACELRIDTPWPEEQEEILCSRCETEIVLGAPRQERGAG